MPETNRPRLRGRMLAVLVTVGMAAGSSAGLFREPSSSESEERKARDQAVPFPMVERVEVRFVTLDLVVEEKVRGRWRRITNLPRDRVGIWVGAGQVELELFDNRCRETGATALASTTPSGSRAPAGPAADPSMPIAPGEDPDREQPTKYVLYFDLTHLTWGGYHEAFKAALKWAEEALPTDEVMIAMGGDGLRIVRPMAPAGSTLREDLRAVRESAPVFDTWAHRESERINEIADIAALAGSHAGRSLANSYAAVDYYRVRASASNLRALMTQFGSLEGTKNLVLFQETIRFRPGSEYPLSTDLSDTMSILRPLAGAANERNVRMYPVFAGGMDRIDDALTFLASQTGGRWVENTNRIGEVFDRVAEDESCFYRIGFQVPVRLTGETERIRVEITGDGKYRVRHRETVGDPTREQIDRDLLQAAFLNPGFASAFPVEAAATPLVDHLRGDRVRIQVGFDLKELLALPEGGPDEDSLQARVMVGGTIVPLQDDDPSEDVPLVQGIWSDVDPSRRSFHFGKQSILRIPSGALEGPDRDLLLTQEVDTPPGRYRLVAVVLDQLAHSVSSAIAELSIPLESSVLGPIHLAVEDPRALPLEEEAEDEPEVPGRPKKKRVTSAPAVLPTQARILTDAVLDASLPGQLVYALCDVGPDPSEEPDPVGEAPAFPDWNTHRSLICAGGDRSLPMAGQRFPVPGVERDCVLWIEPLPASFLAPGDCRFQVTVEPQGAEPVTRSLEFRVVRPEG